MMFIPLRNLALIIATLFTLAGCSNVSGGSSMPNSNELLQQSDESREALSERMEEIIGILDPAGGAPVDRTTLASGGIETCDDEETEYRWTARSDVGNRDGWQFPKDETEWRMEIGEQLHDLGWESITGTSFDAEGPDTTMVYASYPGVVEAAMLAFHPGDTADGVSIRLTGTCQPGSYREVLKLHRERAGN